MKMSAAFLLSAIVQFLLGLVVAWLLGPAEFGVYALVVAAGIFLQTFAFEWLRLAATRFFRAGSGVLRKALLLAFLFAAVACLVVSGLAGAATRSLLTLDRAAILLIPGLAIAAGFLDLASAMLRAQFLEGAYARVLMVRNGLAIILVPAAAALTGWAEAAGGALLASLALAAIYAWRVAKAAPAPASDSEVVAQAAEPDPPSLLAMIGYSGPVVLTNLLYLGLFFAIRSWAAFAGGLALAGQVSLALDFVLKLFTTIGSALDLWLFQRAVKASHDGDEAAGEALLHRNAEIILAVLLVMAIGLVLVIDAFQPLLVRPDFRGTFGHAVMMLTPGVFLYALIQYVLHPYAQLARRTWALVLTALAVVVVALAGGAMLTLLPPGIPGLALVLAAAMVAGTLLLAQLSPGYSPPGRAYLVRLGAAILAMAVPATLAQQQLGGVAGGFAAASFGAAGFMVMAWVTDLAGVRRGRVS